MARYQHGRDVYDDQTDQWTRHDSDADAAAYCEQVESVFHDATVVVAASPRISGQFSTVGLPASMDAFATTSAYCIASSDPVRQRVRIGVQGGSTGNGVLIGSRSDILSGHGYFINTGEDVTVDSTAEIWCCGYTIVSVSDATTLIVSSIQEYAS